MRKKIRGVSFDFGGTLYDYYPSNSEIWSRIAKRLGLAIAPDDPRIKDGMRKQNDAYYQMGKLSTASQERSCIH